MNKVKRSKNNEENYEYLANEVKLYMTEGNLKIKEIIKQIVNGSYKK
jgi:hypothetical protein